MAGFGNSFFDDLLLQARFTPLGQKLRQLDNCQHLAKLLEKGKSYPKDFLIFHITGYHSKTSDYSETFESKGLIKDLAGYSEQLSRHLKIPSAAMTDKYLTHQGLEKKFHVCAKTLQRWRRQGLIGRYLVYPDGKSRLAFNAQVVANFVEKNRRKVAASRQFSRISDDEKRAIVHRLTQWSERCPDHRQEAIKRTAHKFGRSREGIRLLLERWEAQQDRKLFEKRSESMTPEVQLRIFQRYEQGVPIQALTREFGRSRSNIYRAILLHRAAKWLPQPIEFIGGDYFSKIRFPESRKILEVSAELFPDNLSPPPPSLPVINSLDSIDTYASTIVPFSVLSPRQEYFLFRQYNYLKYLAGRLQQKMAGQHPLSGDLRQLDSWMNQAEQIKNLLICHNLRLILSIARKHTRSETEIAELISEGNITLLNAVEKFDFTRGNKFSTYATWAIIKRFASLRRGQATSAEYLAEEDQFDVVNDGRVVDNRITAIERDRKSLLEAIRESLEERERLVVEYHFGLHEPSKVPGQRKPRSLSQIAELLGLSKERIRQLELSALQKLRRMLSPEQFELLTQN